MPITMRGPWTVSVKSKSAAYAQRFVITGSSNGIDGPHEYSNSTPPPAVSVEGNQWTVAVEHKAAKNKPWVRSAVRLGTPNEAGNTISVDIRSNDTGSDEDYNDLVLTCATTVTDFDHVVYGKVKSYSGFCRHNPCWGPYVVLDTRDQLVAALRDAALRPIIKRLYPNQVRLVEKVEPIEEFDEPTRFRPLMLPLTGSASESRKEIAAKASLGSSVISNHDAGILANYKDLHLKPCKTQVEPGLLLRFIEYDRTAAELGGGPYTGTGNRQALGLSASDEAGNYLFRFTRSLADIVQELDDEVPGGPPSEVQLRPDLIVQVVEPGSTLAEHRYETGLYSDIPRLKRINLCFRDLGHRPVSCGTGRVFERIGDVFVLPGMANTFDADGRITVSDANADFTTERAAWTGTLRVWGCFSKEKKNPVKRYTIRYKRPTDTSWNFVAENEFRTNLNYLGSPPTDPGHKIGPESPGLHVDGGAEVSVPSYENVETDDDWAPSTRYLKLKMQSSLYAGVGNPGAVQFRIDGYDATGQPVAGATDDLTLYIDNDPAIGDIESISQGSFSPGECALFELPSGMPKAPLTVKFRADQPNGHLQRYRLRVFRGSNANVAVMGSEPIDKSYASSMGASFRGTVDVPTSSLGWLESDVTPLDNWLPAGKAFCAFAFELLTRRRATNGRSMAAERRQHIELIGIGSAPPDA